MNVTIWEMVKLFNLKFESIDDSIENIADNYTCINWDLHDDIALALWEELPKRKRQLFFKQDWLEATVSELTADITEFFEISADELGAWEQYTYALIFQNDKDIRKFVVGLSSVFDYTNLTQKDYKSFWKENYQAPPIILQ